MNINDKPPLVSVAIITYNQREYLKECIESCLAQSYPNLEIVVADDGSTDGTHELLKNYERNYPDKFVLRLSEDNRGITINSNAAHFACSGKYIAWMGGDDLMLPNKISKQVEYMENNPECALCFHDLEVFRSSDGKILGNRSRHMRSQHYDFRNYVRAGTINGASASMVRRECAPVWGFREELPVASDWLYWTETLAKGHYAFGLREILGKYRRHDRNITNRPIDQKIGQNIVDYINACGFVLVEYPEVGREALYRLSGVLLYLRFTHGYLNICTKSLFLGFRWRTLGAIFIYLCTFGLVKF